MTMKPTKQMLPILLIITIILTLLQLAVLPAFAQDETPTPEESAATQEATALATVEPTSELASATPLPTATQLPTATDLPTLTPVPDFTPTPTPLPPPAPSDSNGSSVVVIVISILTLVLGGGTLVTMVANFRKDAAGVAATEALGNSVPNEFAMELVKLLKGAISGAEIAIEALDHVPAASKPGIIAQFTVAELRAEIERQEAAARG